MDKLSELKYVFQENVSDKNVSFERCLHNFSDYMEALAESCNQDCSEKTQRLIVHEIDSNLFLLRQKAIDPNNVCTKFVLWKN